jgi:rRNA maturation RNase YbeY
LKNLKVYSFDNSINKNKVHSLVNLLSKEMDFKIESLEINFISGSDIFVLNKSFLKHNSTTDIITFNYSKSKDLLDGELFISIDDAKKNAKIFKVSYKNEITRLIIHGILHLLGFDDTSREKKIIMKSYENRLLNTFNFILL